MTNLHEKQSKILEYLMDHPEGAILEEIAKFLGVTKTAAKEHIIKIDSLGLLRYQDSKGLRGRPRRRYLLSENGQETFPRQYSWLSNVLLEHLSIDLGAAATKTMMKALAKRVSLTVAHRFDKLNTSNEMLNEVVRVLNELGYRASLKQSDLRKGAIIQATNCVYHNVAKNHPELCSFDVNLIREATGGMHVALEKCIARGDVVCRFCIRKEKT